MSVSATLDEIHAMFRAENAAMLDAAIQRMEGAIDARMTGYENRISKEVSDLQRRAEQLELRKKARADENNDPAVQEAKRRRRSLSVETGSDGMGSTARSHASLRRHDDEERHTVVFSGFTAKSHKMLPIDYAKLQLLWWKGGLMMFSLDFPRIFTKSVMDYAMLQLAVVGKLAVHADVCDLGDRVFTPNIRTSVWSLALQMLGGGVMDHGFYGGSLLPNEMILVLSWVSFGDCFTVSNWYELHGRWPYGETDLQDGLAERD